MSLPQLQRSVSPCSVLRRLATAKSMEARSSNARDEKPNQGFRSSPALSQLGEDIEEELQVTLTSSYFWAENL